MTSTDVGHLAGLLACGPRVRRHWALRVPPWWGCSGPRCLHEHHLLLVGSGRGHWRAGTTSVALAAGTAILADAGQEVQFAAERRDPPRILQFAFATASTISHPTLWRVDPLLVEPELLRVAGTWLGARGGASALSDSWLLLFLQRWLQRCDAVDRPDPRLEDLRLELDADPLRRWTVAAMAAACDWSPRWFARRFRAAYGLPPKSYLLRRRMQAALEALADGLSVAATAEALGYDDPALFARQFRQIHGRPPGRCRGRPAAAQSAG